MEIICGSKKYEMEKVVDQYSTMLYRLAMVRMGNKEEAEEVVQDTFLKLIYHGKKGKTFRDEEHLKAWLLTVAINRGKSILNLSWNRRTEGRDSVAERAAPKQQTAYAYEYVMRLPEKYRIAVQLFYYEQLSTDQIAGYMKTKPATVRSYLHRSREKLREMMEADGYVG